MLFANIAAWLSFENINDPRADYSVIRRLSFLEQQDPVKSRAGVVNEILPSFHSGWAARLRWKRPTTPTGYNSDVGKQERAPDAVTHLS